MPDYSWDEMTAADIGEEYYDWVAQQGSYSEGDTSFWENLLGPQFEGMEYASFDNFMSEYGGYLPEDFELGPSSLARAGRLADLQQEQFVDVVRKTLLEEHIDLSLIHISEPTRPERIA